VRAPPGGPPPWPVPVAPSAPGSAVPFPSVPAVLSALVPVAPSAPVPVAPSAPVPPHAEVTVRPTQKEVGGAERTSRRGGGGAGSFAGFRAGEQNLERDGLQRIGIEIRPGFRAESRSRSSGVTSAARFFSESEPKVDIVPRDRVHYEIRLAPAASGPQHAASAASGPQQADPAASGPQQADPAASGPQHAAPAASGPQQADPAASGPQQGNRSTNPRGRLGAERTSRRGGGDVSVRPIQGGVGVWAGRAAGGGVT